MFPDSAIADEYSCCSKKSAYLALFGITPYYSSDLFDEVKQQEHYVLLFDETLHREIKKQQTDMYIRIWDVNQVTTKYYTSPFLGHTKDTDMLDVIEPVISSCGYSKLGQLSMDGSNVNVILHKHIQEHIEHNTARSLQNVATCTLHTLHNAFKGLYVNTVGHHFVAYILLLLVQRISSTTYLLGFFIINMNGLIFPTCNQ